MNIKQIISGWPLWISCGVIVALVFVQAIVFAIHAKRAALKIGLEKSQVKNATKASIITAIGPSIVILSGMLSLLIPLGAPISWARLSIVGGVMYESVAAGIGTQTTGVMLGTDAMTPEAFVMAIWTMILCSIGWVIFATIFANRMDRVSRRLTQNGSRLYASISACAIIGVFAALSAGNFVKLNKSALACLIGAAVMFLMIQITERANLMRLKQWNLPIAIISAVIIVALI